MEQIEYLFKGDSYIYFNPKLIIYVDYDDEFPSIKFEYLTGVSWTITKPEDAVTIPQEKFEKYFKKSLTHFVTADWGNQAEYYSIIENQRIEIILFTTDPKNKFVINIIFSYDPKGPDLYLGKERSFSKRKGYRTKGTAISDEQFKAALQASMVYIQDTNSYYDNMDQFEGKLRAILNKEDITVDFQTINTLEYLQQLEQKKAQLQHELIENDEYTILERSTLRGQLTGIEYAIQVYNLFQINKA
ncbi:hypothetical protein [Adhaeribacter pallidiroseus]|uniref:Uncharacterized protein n=1 Tax=Adhaeribacter pallidiroseus TaxID=2072847 RepID=A0A369QI99_9BACT|nr:hypothetical protein [Adhaeribacter pallidiroseus]RDC64633.1 hypothetical protein AHMF7616_03249 [Adhaeribacter pallidiroseus]